MPELPEVETIKRQLEKKIVGKILIFGIYEIPQRRMFGFPISTLILGDFVNPALRT
ncbi:MAG: DNA-formamidopyrimidine glycosylase family protein [Candidatus Nealsonbacteria bacterium]